VWRDKSAATKQLRVMSEELPMYDWYFRLRSNRQSQSKIGNSACRVRTESPADEPSMAQSEEEMAVYFVFYVSNV
jgi:hypothetical protein